MKSPFLAAAVLLSAFASLSPAASISINFLDSQDVSFGASEAGAPGFAQPNWNHLLTDWSGNVDNDALFTTGLVDSDGASLAGVLQNIAADGNTDPVHYDAANTWRSPAGNGDANATLMNGYLDDGTDNQPYVNVSLAPDVYTSYTVVLYVNGDGQNGAVGRYWLEEWTDPLAAGTVITDQIGISSNSYTGTFVQAGATFGQTGTPMNVDVASGNFIVFQGITARNLRVRSSGNGDPEDFGRGPLNAIQIIEDSNDTDGDGLPDVWESANMLDAADDGTTGESAPGAKDGPNGALGDPDADGLTNLQEFQGGTNPQSNDTDGDTLLDGVESGSGMFVDDTDTGTSPTNGDTDGDGLGDGVETNTDVFVDADDTGSDPNQPDSDLDGLPDGWEVTYLLDPNEDGMIDLDQGPDGDPDTDSSPNSQEFARGTNPIDSDSDDDTVVDGHEDDGGVWMSATQTGTDPLDPDTDGDTLSDGVETNTGDFVDANDTGTNPNLRDSDDDGFFDDDEITAGTDPTDPNELPVFPVPIGYWPFDDQGAATTLDLSPNANHATLTGGTAYVAGHTGMAGDFALDLDGVDDSATTALALNGLAKFTMAGWVQFSVTQTDRSGLFGQNDIAEFGLIDAANMQLWNPTGGAINVALPPATWRHIAVVGDATGRTIFVDGIVAGQGVVGTPLGTSAFFFNIGGSGIFDDIGNFFLGQLDDVAVWDTALSPKLIASLASGERAPILTTPTGDLAISDFSYDPLTNMARITVVNTTPGTNYGLDESVGLDAWGEIMDFVGAPGTFTTTLEFSGPDNPRLPATHYRVRAAQ